ncbi:MAG: class I SAM-dependent methyltransferase [Phycisphaeraceae bacterium]
MLIDRTCTHLQRRWRGSAVRLRVNGRAYELGHGTPRVEVVVHRPAVLARLLVSPSLTFGEGYMRGDIEVYGSLLDLLQGAYCTFPAARPSRLGELAQRCAAAIAARRRAIANARHHYDIGNDFYRLWLDPSLTYSCACFLRESDDLTTAQHQKLELLCRKARLQPGQRLLDIGCGWGSLLLHAARHHGVRAVGVTPAREQADYIEQEAAQQGLGDRVEVARGDWRDVSGRFDRVISVGMFEHVGRAHYQPFLQRWRDLLAEGGLSVLHTIGRMCPAVGDPWIRRYIFPGGYLPALEQIASIGADAGLWIVDVENLRQHYARTLACWAANYQAVREQVVAMHGEQFARMWWLYLQGAEAAFRWGGLHLWQIVLARDERAPWPLDREVRLADVSRARVCVPET